MKACSRNECQQGRLNCPTPSACQFPEQDDPPDWVGSLLIAAALVCALAAVVIMLR